MGPEHRDVEPIIEGLEGVLSPSGHQGEQSGCKVPRGIDGIAAVEPEADSNVEDGKPHVERGHVRRDGVPAVIDGGNDDEKESRADDLVQESPADAEKLLRVSCEDPGGLVDKPAVAVYVFVLQDGLAVDAVDDGGTNECTQVLSKNVVNGLDPGKLT